MPEWMTPEENAKWRAAMARSRDDGTDDLLKEFAARRAERKADEKLDISTEELQAFIKFLNADEAQARSELPWAEYLRWQNERDARTNEIADLMTAGTPHDELPMQLNYAGWLCREREMAKGMTQQEAEIAISLEMIASEPRITAARKADAKRAKKKLN